jgi:hypothetical protein
LTEVKTPELGVESKGLSAITCLEDRTIQVIKLKVAQSKKVTTSNVTSDALPLLPSFEGVRKCEFLDDG